MQRLHSKIVTANIVLCLLSQKRIQDLQAIHQQSAAITWVDVSMTTHYHRLAQIIWIIPLLVEVASRLEIWQTINAQLWMTMRHSWIMLLILRILPAAATATAMAWILAMNSNWTLFAVRQSIKTNCGDSLTLFRVWSIVTSLVTADATQITQRCLIAVWRLHSMLGKWRNHRRPFEINLTKFPFHFQRKNSRLGISSGTTYYN